MDQVSYYCPAFQPFRLINNSAAVSIQFLKSLVLLSRIGIIYRDVDTIETARMPFSLLNLRLSISFSHEFKNWN